eukprot:PhF_6_TR18549/c0_g1_i1/m.27090
MSLSELSDLKHSVSDVLREYQRGFSSSENNNIMMVESYATGVLSTIRTAKEALLELNHQKTKQENNIHEKTENHPRTFQIDLIVLGKDAEDNHVVKNVMVQQKAVIGVGDTVAAREYMLHVLCETAHVTRDAANFSFYDIHFNEYVALGPSTMGLFLEMCASIPVVRVKAVMKKPVVPKEPDVDRVLRVMREQLFALETKRRNSIQEDDVQERIAIASRMLSLFESKYKCRHK